ncbi:MAG: hypothetical protein AAFV29_07295, partial [Myxococcota bacterium]
YNFDGNVLNSPETTRRFLNGDKAIYSFQLEGPGKLPFQFKDLKLKTHDEPGSLGYSAVVMVAKQNGQTIMEWTASVTQGQMPVYDQLPNSGERVRARKDQLRIQDLTFMIPVTYGADNKASVQVEVYFENSGKRT